MVDVGEAIGVYILFGALFLLLGLGLVGRAMGMTDPSAPSTLCCVDSGDDVDDEEAQRELRVSFERESKHKREAKEYETKHKQAMLAKKGSASRAPPRPKAATVESPGKVLKKAAPPSGSSEGARPSSLKFAEGPHPSPGKGGSGRPPSTKQPSASSVAGPSGRRQSGAAGSNPRSSSKESDASSTSMQRAPAARPKATKGPLANKGATF